MTDLITLVFHTLFGWLHYLSLPKMQFGGNKQHYFARTTLWNRQLSVVQLWAFANISSNRRWNAQWLASLIETPVRTRLLRKFSKGGWHELREPFKNYIRHLGLVRNKNGQKYNKVSMCHSISRFIEAAPYMCWCIMHNWFNDVLTASTN